MYRIKNILIIFSLFVVTCIASTYVFSQESIWSNIKNLKTAKYVGNEACIECHADEHPILIDTFSNSAHGKLNKVENGCEACHGPGSLHTEEGDASKIFSFSNDDKIASQICINCHKSNDILMWKGSEHDMSNVNCTKCHFIHKSKDDFKINEKELTSKVCPNSLEHRNSLKSSDPELCYSCHNSIRIKSNMMSHHPINEGKMTCSSCHNPHGGEKMLNGDGRNINDLCLKCHPQYQGPFVYEHEAVVEDCTICHDPHGSFSDNLLKKTEPYLCYQCHSIHTSIRIHSDVQGVAGTKCSYCHPQIHGSNQAPQLGAR